MVHVIPAVQLQDPAVMSTKFAKQCLFAEQPAMQCNIQHTMHGLCCKGACSVRAPPPSRCYLPQMARAACPAQAPMPAQGATQFYASYYCSQQGLAHLAAAADVENSQPGLQFRDNVLPALHAEVTACVLNSCNMDGCCVCCTKAG